MKYIDGTIDYGACRIKIENDIDAPEYVMDMADEALNGHPTFGPDCYSVTEILKSPKQIVQKRRLLYAGELVTPLTESVPLWDGTIHHSHVEKYMDKYNGKYLKEVRMGIKRGDITISGAFDSYDIVNNILIDHKFAKEYTFTLNKKMASDEWYKQLALYMELIEATYGRRPKKLKIFCTLKDWTTNKTVKKDYPQKNIQWIEWDAPSKEYTSRLLDEAFEKAKLCKKLLNEDEVPCDCTSTDCWCKEDYAVSKPNAGRASKTFKLSEMSKSEADRQAREYCRMQGDGFRVYHRVSEAKNCLKYCVCRRYCEQGKRMAQMEEIKEDVTDCIPY